jgi:predicted Zn-dependent protease
VTRQLLLAAGEDPRTWQVAVFARDEINAFALPGGRIGVFDGMFRVADTPDKLAAVLGHEIGHVQARHGQERMNAEALRDLGLRILFTALQLGDVQQADRIAAVLGAGIDFGLLRPYSRQQELEADRRGLALMTKSGFQGQEAVALWRRMDAMDGGGGPTFLATHPAPAQRIEALQELLQAGPRSG